MVVTGGLDSTTQGKVDAYYTALDYAGSLRERAGYRTPNQFYNPQNDLSTAQKQESSAESIKQELLSKGIDVTRVPASGYIRQRSHYVGPQDRTVSLSAPSNVKYSQPDSLTGGGVTTPGGVAPTPASPALQKASSGITVSPALGGGGVAGSGVNAVNGVSNNGSLSYSSLTNDKLGQGQTSSGGALLVSRVPDATRGTPVGQTPSGDYIYAGSGGTITQKNYTPITPQDIAIHRVQEQRIETKNKMDFYETQFTPLGGVKYLAPDFYGTYIQSNVDKGIDVSIQPRIDYSNPLEGSKTIMGKIGEGAIDIPKNIVNNPLGSGVDIGIGLAVGEIGGVVVGGVASGLASKEIVSIAGKEFSGLSVAKGFTTTAGIVGVAGIVYEAVSSPKSFGENIPSLVSGGIGFVGGFNAVAPSFVEVGDLSKVSGSVKGGDVGSVGFVRGEVPVKVSEYGVVREGVVPVGGYVENVGSLGVGKNLVRVNVEGSTSFMGKELVVGGEEFTGISTSKTLPSGYTKSSLVLKGDSGSLYVSKTLSRPEMELGGVSFEKRVGTFSNFVPKGSGYVEVSGGKTIGESEITPYSSVGSDVGSQRVILSPKSSFSSLDKGRGLVEVSSGSFVSRPLVQEESTSFGSRGLIEGQIFSTKEPSSVTIGTFGRGGFGRRGQFSPSFGTSQESVVDTSFFSSTSKPRLVPEGVSYPQRLEISGLGISGSVERNVFPVSFGRLDMSYPTSTTYVSPPSQELFSRDIMSHGVPSVPKPKDAILPPSTITVPDQIVTPIPKITTFTGTIQDTSVPPNNPVPPVVPSFVPPSVPPVLPIGGGVGFPSFAPPAPTVGGTGRSSKQRYKYTPSLTAISFGLRGKQPKGVLDPLSVRPLPLRQQRSITLTSAGKKGRYSFGRPPKTKVVVKRAKRSHTSTLTNGFR